MKVLPATPALRLVITLVVAPMVAATVILWLLDKTDLSSGSVLVLVALPTAAGCYWSLRSAHVSIGLAIGGTLAVIVLSYVLVVAIISLFLVN